MFIPLYRRGQCANAQSRRTRLTRLVPDFQTIIIDEAHHAKLRQHIFSASGHKLTGFFWGKPPLGRRL